LSIFGGVVSSDHGLFRYARELQADLQLICQDPQNVGRFTGL